MLVAAGQFAVTPDWTENAQTCVSMMRQAAGGCASGSPGSAAGARR